MILSHIKKNENLAKDRGNTAKQQPFPIEKEQVSKTSPILSHNKTCETTHKRT
nr:MAG TPA: hypothetical protein [Caudoviricetes sp.]DAR05618.1 MAG TPA: hypothetical protein [Caudoviricetes sp.]